MDGLCIQKQTPSIWFKHYTGGALRHALQQDSCFVGDAPKFLSVLRRLETIREKFQSVIAILR